MYVGKDSYIDKNTRHKNHFMPSRYDDQPINGVLQNNTDRYSYQVLVWDVEDENTLNALEIQYIRQLQPKFNFTDGGDGVSGFQHSKETRRKLSEAKKGQNNPMFGKKHSEETKRKMSEANKGENNPNWGKAFSDEHKKKISEAKSQKMNNTGFYRVSKAKRKDCRKGFRWLYRYYNKNNERKGLSSTNLKKLEQKVLLNNLEWKIINEKYAKQSLREDKI